MEAHFLAINERNAESFSRIPVDKRIIFISQCLRKLTVCPSKRKKWGQGISCQSCSDDCFASQIIKLAEKKGYVNIFIVSGFTAVARLNQELKPQAVIGIACPIELEEAISKFEIPLQVVSLTNHDCELGSSVNLKEVKNTLSL